MTCRKGHAACGKGCRAALLFFCRRPPTPAGVGMRPWTAAALLPTQAPSAALKAEKDPIIPCSGQRHPPPLPFTLRSGEPHSDALDFFVKLFLLRAQMVRRCRGQGAGSHWGQRGGRWGGWCQGTAPRSSSVSFRSTCSFPTAHLPPTLRTYQIH